MGPGKLRYQRYVVVELVELGGQKQATHSDGIQGMLFEQSQFKALLVSDILMNFILRGKESVEIIHSQVNRELGLLETITNFTYEFEHYAADLGEGTA